MNTMMTQPWPQATKPLKLIRPTTIAAFVTVFGLIAAEWIGSGFIYLAVLLWIPVVGRDPLRIGRDVLKMGVVPWIMPALCLASTAWSPVPGVTFRGGLELFLTVGLALLCVRMLKAGEMVLLVWLGFGVIVVLSVFINHKYLAFDTGQYSSAGVFINKNTLGSCAGALGVASLPLLFTSTRPISTRLAAFALLGLACVMNLLARSVADSAAMAVSLIALAGLLFGETLPRTVRTAYARMILVVGVAVAAVGSFITLAFSAELLSLVGKSPTLTGRTLLWYYASEFRKSNPWLGRGFFGFWWQGQPEAEFLWKAEHVASRSGFHFHSLYWQLRVDLGDVGLIIGALSIAVTCWYVVRWVVTDPNPNSAFSLSILLFALIIQLQGLDLFQPFTPIYFMFILAHGYGKTEVRRAAMTRMIPRYTVMVPAE